MRLIVTRPEEDGAALTELLGEHGHEATHVPMMRIERRQGVSPDLSGIAGLLCTSANGVRALAAASPGRELPLYAVGDRTARAAREAGFGDISVAGGDVEALAGLVLAVRKPEHGALLHVAGSDRAGDLQKRLGDAGYDVRTAVLYDAVPSESLPDALVSALTRGAYDGVLLYSPRTARIWGRLTDAAGLASARAGLDAWCLSAAVAEGAREFPHRAVHTAANPTQAALVELIDRHDPRQEQA